MHVLMIGTHRGSPDGVTVETYQDGERYEVPESLGTVFVTEGWAEVVEEEPDGEANTPEEESSETSDAKPTRKTRKRR